MHFLEPHFQNFLGEVTGPPIKGWPLFHACGLDKTTACLFIGTVRRLLKVILHVLPIFGRTLQTATKTDYIIIIFCRSRRLCCLLLPYLKSHEKQTDNNPLQIGHLSPCRIRVLNMNSKQSLSETLLIRIKSDPTVLQATVWKVSYHRFCWYATFENKTPTETFPKFVSLACYWQIRSKSTNHSH